MIDNHSGSEFRRIRLYTSGLIFGNIKYKVQFDFAGGEVRLKDAYIIITKVPFVGNIQVGQFKEPLGLEVLMSSNNIAMIEWVWKGTNTVGWPSMGISATNKYFEVRGVSVMTIEKGLIIKNNEFWDWNTLVTGMGIE